MQYNAPQPDVVLDPKSQEAIDIARTKLGRLEAEIVQASKTLTAVKTDISEAVAELSELNSKIESKTKEHSDLVERNKALESVNGSLAQSNAELERNQEKLKEAIELAESDFVIRRQNLEHKEFEVEKEKSAIATDRAVLEEAKASFQSKKKKLTEVLEEIET